MGFPLQHDALKEGGIGARFEEEHLDEIAGDGDGFLGHTGDVLDDLTTGHLVIAAVTCDHQDHIGWRTCLGRRVADGQLIALGLHMDGAESIDAVGHAVFGNKLHGGVISLGVLRL